MSAWISIAERLPEFDVPVWLYCPDADHCPIIICVRTDDPEGWCWARCRSVPRQSLTTGAWVFDEDEDDDYQPTHWQHLPEVPK